MKCLNAIAIAAVLVFSASATHAADTAASGQAQVLTQPSPAMHGKSSTSDDWSTSARTKCPDDSAPKTGDAAACPKADAGVAARTTGSPLKGIDVKLGKQ